MAVAETSGLDPVLGFALVGVLGVGSQWLAWRLRLPSRLRKTRLAMAITRCCYTGALVWVRLT